jgi:hypothetical protein
MPGPFESSPSVGVESSVGVDRLSPRETMLALGFSSAFASNLEEDDIVESGVREPCEGDPGTDAPDAGQLGAGAFLFFELSSSEESEWCSDDIVEERESESSAMPKFEFALIGNEFGGLSILRDEL